MKIISTFVLICAVMMLMIASSSSAAPTGGTVTVSPSYFQKATAHLKSAFDQSVVSTFVVGGLQGPLPSLSPCIINYADLKLASFTESGITFNAVTTASNSTQTATHQIIISNPSFTLQTVEYSALCAFASGVGNLQMQATGTVTGSWSAASLTIDVTETISNNNAIITVGAATLKDVISMTLVNNYDIPLTNNNFIFDDFWSHHVTSTMQQAVNAEISSLFNQNGAPISIITNNMNSLFSQWPQVCGIDQLTIPGTIIINTQPLCRTVTIADLPVQDLCVVQVSASSSVSDGKNKLKADNCQTETCWSPSAYPNNGNIMITYNSCTQCNIDQGKITGTSGIVVFNA